MPRAGEQFARVGLHVKSCSECTEDQQLLLPLGRTAEGTQH